MDKGSPFIFRKQKYIQMKKILLAFDGSHFSEGAFKFAKILNERQRILLTAAFLAQVDYANLWSYSGGDASGAVFIPLVEDADTEAVVKNIEHFENMCKKNDIEYRVHKDFTDFALPELKKESRFADLLVIGSEKFYENIRTGDVNDYLQDTLHGVECPVIIVPEKFDFPKTNILAYDGSGSSVYAIKEFAYLFPELTSNPTVLVFAKEDGENTFPDEVNIEELTARHFPDLTLVKLQIDPRKYFVEAVQESKSSILVCGSFGRSMLSRIFRKSFVNDIIRQHCIPIFIAHHK